jgi:putative FmdB family regulatory protein
MPTYEYACTSCHRHFEVVQRFSDAALEVCEVCGGALKRVFHPVGIVLKGSGFYATDNRSGKKFTPAATKEGGGSETASGSESSGSESSGSESSGGSGSSSSAAESSASAPEKKADKKTPGGSAS